MYKGLKALSQKSVMYGRTDTGRTDGHANAPDCPFKCFEYTYSIYIYTALTIFLQEGNFGTLSVLHREDLSTPIVMLFPMMECIHYICYKH